jgi:hypothetical protein
MGINPLCFRRMPCASASTLLKPDLAKNRKSKRQIYAAERT